MRQVQSRLGRPKRRYRQNLAGDTVLINSAGTDYDVGFQKHGRAKSRSSRERDPSLHPVGPQPIVLSRRECSSRLAARVGQ